MNGKIVIKVIIRNFTKKLKSKYPKVFDSRGKHGQLTELFYYIDEALALPEINSVLDIRGSAVSPDGYTFGSSIEGFRVDNNVSPKTENFKKLKKIILKKYPVFFKKKSNHLKGKDHKNFIDHVGYLKEYRAKFNHIFLKHNEKYKGIGLGFWLITQQGNFKDLSVSDPDLITDLNEIGVMDNGCQSMIWDRTDRFRGDNRRYAFLQMLGISPSDPSNEKFFRNNYAQQLLDFKEERGHILVSLRLHKSLYNFLKSMRLHYKNKELTGCEIEFLERVGRTNNGKQSMIWDHSKLPKSKKAKQLFIEELLRE